MSATLTSIMKSLVAMLVALGFVVQVAVADDADTVMRAALAERLEGIAAADISATPIPGLYEVRVGPNLVYVTGDGRYLLRGSLIDLQDHRNVTLERRHELRAAWLASLDESTMVVFDPAGPVRHTLTVFTDTECTFCRRFHSEIDAVLALGIRVRYVAYPALGERSVEQAEAVWCARDRQSAMTRAKAGQRLRPVTCDTVPIQTHMAWARDIGVEGTPAIFTETGGFISGYVPPDRLLEEIAIAQ